MTRGANEWRKWHPLVLRNRLVRRRSAQRPVQGLGVLSFDPLILYTISSEPVFLEAIQQAFRDQPLAVLRQAPWDQDDRIVQREVAWYQRGAEREHPQHRIFHLCDDRGSYDGFRQLGVPCIYLHQNAFLDEGLFTIDDTIEREFDAIYNGAFAPYKRHELATGVGNLACLGYIAATDPNTWAAQEVISRFRQLLPQATWINWLGGSYVKITPNEVVGWLNRARVGLILSEVEGPCYAATEYLLCGLPVVSTPSRGGRDAFFDPDYVKIVEPNAEAVASGVREMIARNLDPRMIRDRTIEKLKAHRAVLDGTLQMLANLAEGTPSTPTFERFRFNRQSVWIEIEDIRAVVELARQGLFLQPAQPEIGAHIVGVAPGSVYAKSGLRTHDLLLSIDGWAVERGSARAILGRVERSTSRELIVTVNRLGKPHTLVVQR